ncbi:hypothetical protein FEP07_04243 [Burkholderia multivorans]|nr:hypothetical protein [Burkholderia multivorans]MDR9267464.1 hypothetical protein [Burkholderia multivorans]MDR9286921.1 hypothetical protein [Burkholderia multivorans]MDR9289198.1 hypothetical protein [Burkholderia multivorans]MDR9312004.1 hypothetical protein [Burkholderia multivorans]
MRRFVETVSGTGAWIVNWNRPVGVSSDFGSTK